MIPAPDTDQSKQRAIPNMGLNKTSIEKARAYHSPNKRLQVSFACTGSLKLLTKTPVY
ncbi:unnamed protein product [Fusarium graminearum]|uniref:Chromosome 1, complete genome n=1 Tax=Gibberella zeae (strain ATCC MYA-4620 / CBS 123657 / FGSC 9075 / NRRL 31084 / PH-1) TaxID=229533 RepID=A0A098D0Y7_GIBZE|nr:unnamed protein product [Fusarium graminearum]CZS75838.1 unnamed protein product [Fusarium graminearum]